MKREYRKLTEKDEERLHKWWRENREKWLKIDEEKTYKRERKTGKRLYGKAAKNDEETIQKIERKVKI